MTSRAIKVLPLAPHRWQNRLFILPTWHGIIFLFLIVVIVLIAASSSNNLVYTLSFVLFSLILVVIPSTHLNLTNLDIEFIESHDGFAGEFLVLRLSLLNRSIKSRCHIQVQALGYGPQAAFFVEEVRPRSRSFVELTLPVVRRGVIKIPPLQLSSVFPLGLFRVWTLKKVDGDLYIYPQRKGRLPLFQKELSVGEGHRLGFNQETHHEDFREHRRFQMGESQFHVDWKAYARRGELLTKRYESTMPEHYSLLWQDVASLKTEEALSQLSLWIENLRHSPSSFELHLPGSYSGVGWGLSHGQKCLRMLTQYHHPQGQDQKEQGGAGT